MSCAVVGISNSAVAKHAVLFHTNDNGGNVFPSIIPPHNFVTDLRALQGQVTTCLSDSPHDGNYEEEPNPHVSLDFFGRELTAQDIRRVHSVLTDIAAKVSPFNFKEQLERARIVVGAKGYVLLELTKPPGEFANLATSINKKVNALHLLGVNHEPIVALGKEAHITLLIPLKTGARPNQAHIQTIIHNCEVSGRISLDQVRRAHFPVDRFELNASAPGDQPLQVLGEYSL